jgi:hypothetical protein
MKYETCLVTCRNEQRHGLDFQETFVHVAKWSTIRCFVSLAIQHGWKILHMDVKSALFIGHIKEYVYVKHHCGFIVPSREDKLCKLKRALYKLGQSLGLNMRK